MSSALSAETVKVHGAHMQVTPEQGALLTLLIETLGAERIVELGTFTARRQTRTSTPSSQADRCCALLLL